MPSIYIARDLKAGDSLTDRSLRSVRPGFGLAPNYYVLLLGRRVIRDASKGAPMSHDLFE